MPGRKAHRRVSKLLLGDGHDEVHRAVDWPYKLLGRRHRVLFHDPISASGVGFLAALAGGKNPITGALAGLVHVAQDWSTSGVNRMLKPLRLKKAGGLGGLLALSALVAVLLVLYVAVMVGAFVFVAWAACELVAQIAKYRKNRAEPHFQGEDPGVKADAEADKQHDQPIHPRAAPPVQEETVVQYGYSPKARAALVAAALKEGLPESHYISAKTIRVKKRPPARPGVVPRWYLRRQGRTWGPYTRPQLVGYLTEGRAAPEDLVRRATGGPVKRLHDILASENTSREGGE